MRGAPRGLSLLELVVAMAIFSLIAVMGLQVLGGTLRMRDRLEATASETADLSYALALLRGDLSSMVPLLFYPPEGARPRSALAFDPAGRLEMSLAGQLDLPPVAALGLHRADWRLDPATQDLSRRYWPVLSPVATSARSPEVVVLRGVRGIALRSYWEGQGWVSGSTRPVPPAAPTAGADSDRGPAVANSYGDQLPDAIEVTLDTVDFGPIVLLESLQ